MTNTLRKKDAIQAEVDDLLGIYKSPYLTVEQVGEVCHASRNTLALWRREGIGPPPVRVGRKWLYSVRATAEYLHR